MMKPNTIAYGVRGTVGSAGQTVATTKYSIGTSFRNKYGDRYARILVKCDKAYDLYVMGDSVPFTSTDAGIGGTTAGLVYSATGQVINGTTTTGMGGKVFYVPIAGEHYVLPIVYQASGGNALVTISYATFND